MPQQTRMVWKEKVVELPPTTPPKNEAARPKGDREKGKGKSKQDSTVAEGWKGDRSDDRSWERRRDNKPKEYASKGSSDAVTQARGKQNDGKAGKSNGKAKDDAYQRRQKEDETARRKGGKGKGGFDGVGKGGRGKGGGSPGNAKTVSELESEMARKRDHDVTKQPLEADGISCNVKKHSGMGCAVITMNSGEIRDAVLMRARQRHNAKGDPFVVDISGIDVQVKPHTDKSTQREIKTDIFAAWGHQIEKNTPLEAQTIAVFFDELLREVNEARTGHVISPVMRGPATLATVPPLPPTYSPQLSPPPPPAHVPKVGQILSQSAAFVQPQQTPQHPAPQQPSAFPDQQYQYWLQQQQQQYAARIQQQYAEQQYLRQQQAQQQQQQQQQYSYAQQYYQDQLASQHMAQMDFAPATPVGMTPKPLQIKDPRTGTVIDTLGMNFKKNEGSSPQKIIDPTSGELVSPERVSQPEIS
mmetsp:Transcript_61872/g.96067  ORF Transcript_61872/g.96067 Transcript_61872/m.96067 type:complete len:471 (-) Transcript_61872:161-1573(-)